MNSTLKTVIGVCIFAVAMAALESAVVIYLRHLYYPDGFSIAFFPIDESVLRVELLRELATLVMLGCIGYLAGKNTIDRLAFFLLAFAVWDLFYYAWLKVLIGWPLSFLEWDILFLIPYTWLGPVAAPMICSVTMIMLAGAFLTGPPTVSRMSWLLLILGSACILYTFTIDYGRLIIGQGFWKIYSRLLHDQRFLDVAARLVPQPYNWLLFGFGEILIVSGMVYHYTRFGPIRRWFGAPPPA